MKIKVDDSIHVHIFRTTAHKNNVKACGCGGREARREKEKKNPKQFIQLSSLFFQGYGIFYMFDFMFVMLKS